MIGRPPRGGGGGALRHATCDVIIIIPTTFIVLGLLPYITFLPFYLIVLIQI